MIDIRERIGGALAGPRETAREKFAEAREQVQIIRDAAPTLTTGLLIGAVAIGAVGGWYASKVATRWAVNAEWRERIAAASAPVRAIISEGNAELAATDEQIIEALGDTDAKLSTAERALKNIPATRGDCRINADSLRVK